MKGGYVPSAGDLVWIVADAEIGREQAERRAALVLSPSEYNRAAGLALVCPVTRQEKDYPFEVPVLGKRIQGVAVADQVRSRKWRDGQFTFAERADEGAMENVKALLATLLQIG